MNKALSELLEKEVTRKEFLQIGGVTLVTILGFGNLLSLVSHFVHASHPYTQAEHKGSHGFGASRFGM